MQNLMAKFSTTGRHRWLPLHTHNLGISVQDTAGSMFDSLVAAGPLCVFQQRGIGLQSGAVPLSVSRHMIMVVYIVCFLLPWGLLAGVARELTRVEAGQHVSSAGFERCWLYYWLGAVLFEPRSGG